MSVEPLTEQSQPGAPAAIRQAMHKLPHLRGEDVDELERAIAAAKLPVQQGGVFDSER